MPNNISFTNWRTVRSVTCWGRWIWSSTTLRESDRKGHWKRPEGLKSREYPVVWPLWRPEVAILGADQKDRSLLCSRSGRSHVTLPVPTQLLQTDIHSFLGNKPINVWLSFSCECSRLWLVQHIQWQLNERLICPSKQKRKTPRMYVGLKQPRGDGERYVTPARPAAKETKKSAATPAPHCACWLVSRPLSFSSPEPTILLACGRNRELWEQPFRACAIDEDWVKPDGQNSVISFVISEWLLPSSKPECRSILGAD